MIQCINKMNDKTLAQLIKTHPQKQRLRQLAAGHDTYEIVIIGPAHPGAVKSGWVLSANGRAYAAQDLEKWAPIYAGRRVFFQHGGPRLAGYEQRTLQGPLAKVGRIVESWWQPDGYQVRGRLRVENENWRRIFASPARWRYGFSQNVDGKTTRLHGEGGAVDLVQLTSLLSVDLVDDPAAGGQFIGAPAMTDRQIETWWQDFELATYLNGGNHDTN